MNLIEHIRSLQSKVPPGQWGTQNNKYGTGVLIRQPDDFVNVCWWDCENTYEHTEDCRDLIVAAINALPALLAIAEAANAVQDGMDKRDEDEAEWAAAGTRVSAMEMHDRRVRLARALALLTNHRDGPPRSGTAK